MRKITKQDIEDAWQAWATIEMALPIYDGGWAGNGLTPDTAARMIAHLRFSSVFCDYVLQNEPERVVEVTKPALMKAVAERQRDVEEWLEDWEPLPDSMAKEHSRRRLAESHRFRMELICLRQLWLASLASVGKFGTFEGQRRKRRDRPRPNQHLDHRPE